jgi:uncharacterized protein YciI
MKIAVFYDLAEDGLARIPANYPAHVARLEEFRGRGVLLMAGPLGNPPEGALSIFTDPAAAREFVAGDPFVVNGVVGKWRMVEWDA